MTALLYLIVIAMWAVVLVPIWLKGHDKAHIEKKLEALGEAAPKCRLRQREELTPAQRAFVRRRRTLMGLLTSLIGSVLLSASGAIPIFVVLLPAGALTAFVVAAIRKARAVTTRESKMQQMRRAQGASSVHVSTEVVQQVQVQTQTAVAANPRAWRPAEAYTPSYVTAPRATPLPRVLDAKKPWTADDMLEQAAVMRASRNARVKEAQLRLEEARASAMEKSRKAAIAAANRQVEIQQNIADQQRKAAGE